MRLEARDLHHAYGEVRVLEGIDLAVAEGEVVAIVGPSGCGKSTLLRLMGGLERPTGGAALVAGDPPPGCLNPLTYVFQDFALLPWRTVEGNVSLVLEDHPMPAAERGARVAEALGRVGLADFAGSWPRQLSGGMRQRVAIARALAVSPGVWLMDEPLSALDAQTRELLMDDLVDLWSRERFAALYVTHNLAEAVRLGHRVIVLSRRPGRIRETVAIDMPLPERAARAAELEEVRRMLWETIRGEAAVADRELAGA